MCFIVDELATGLILWIQGDSVDEIHALSVVMFQKQKVSFELLPFCLELICFYSFQLNLSLLFCIGSILLIYARFHLIHVDH